MEKQPISGRMIEFLQGRYTQRRVALGTATEDSTSEPVLTHLKQKGVLRGIIPAFREFQNIISMAAEEEGFILSDRGSFVASFILLGYASTTFFITAAGVKPRKGISEIGNWSFLSKARNKKI